MYTDYTNKYDTSHVAYLEGQTLKEQQVEWAIYVALQPLPEDFNTIPTHQPKLAPKALHIYPIKYIPPYLITTLASAHTTSSTKPPSPQHLDLKGKQRQEPTISYEAHNAKDIHTFVQ